MSGFNLRKQITLTSRQNVRTRHWISTVLVALAMTSWIQTALAQDGAEIKFKRISPQFIAALADPKANAGIGAETWGLWSQDPGPRGVWLSLYPVLKAAGGYAPGNWRFDNDDWWLDENGLLMEKPAFPIAAGRYLVTGEREVTTMLTVHPKDSVGVQKWELDGDASLYDVTHLACRSARYTPVAENSCLPDRADQSEFKVAPGSEMPAVEGCSKQDYSVLIVVGVAVES